MCAEPAVNFDQWRRLASFPCVVGVVSDSISFSSGPNNFNIDHLSAPLETAPN